MRRWTILAAACVLAGFLQHAAAQRGELEVTMRVVLDDASGVDAVLIPLDPPSADDAAPDAREETRPTAGEERAPAEEREPAPTQPENSAEPRAQ